MVGLLDPPLGPGDLVLSDFDGTVSVQDTGIEIITRLELEAAWELEDQWRQGRIGSAECLAKQWAMVRLTEAELLAQLDDMALDPSFPAFVELCRERGASLAVLSDGLDLYVNRMLHRLGLRTCPQPEQLPPLSECVATYANHAEWTPEGVWVSFPCATRDCEACGNCKSAWLRRLRPGHRRVIYLGDGYSDMCVVRQVDVRFAKGHLAEFCEAQGLDYYPLRSFAAVVELLR